MVYKLVCIDLDGTLLPTNHQVSEHTKGILQRAEALGIHIAISTGRSITDANHFSKLLGIKATYISANGAYVVEKERNEVIYKNILGEELIWKIYYICNRYGITPCFHTPEKIIHGKDFGRFLIKLAEKANEMGKAVIHTPNYEINGYQQWVSIIDKEKDNILKAEFFHEDKNIISAIKKELKALGELEVVESLSEEHTEANSKGISKGRAVEVLSGLLGIKREEIVAIGDGDNDVTMIEYAGLGVAMGNSKDYLKEKANYVTASNDEDGVGKAIEKFILNI